MQRLSLLALPVIVVLCTGFAMGMERQETVRFDRADLSFDRMEAYDIPRLAGADMTTEVGNPQLPMETVCLALPPGAIVDGVDVTATRTEVIPGTYHVLPVQKPRPLSMVEDVGLATPANQAVYGSREAYPSRPVEFLGTGAWGGYTVASFAVYPLQYLPQEGRLIFLSEISFTVNYHLEGTRRLHQAGLREPNSLTATMLRQAVMNPTEVIQPVGMADDVPMEYLIITSPALDTVFQRLAEWKTRKGVPARVVLTDDIYASTPGVDNAAKVRNFIAEAHADSGTIWVLLGGDTDQVPDRVCFAMDCEAGGSDDEDSIRCDLYFSDLDGTWDQDGDGTYGEIADNIDMYPDVYVGRAAVENTEEAQAFVNKVLMYERTPPDDYQLDMLYLAMVLWHSPMTDSKESKNFIDDEYVPARFDPITKLYETEGNETWNNVIEALNEGQNIVNHCGHCWYTVMSIGSSHLGIEDMDNLYNAPRFSLLYSIGCWPAAFDYDCIAEHWLNNPDGGGVAFIGNSRYGWGSPGNPLYGYSDRLDQEFFESLFDRGIYHLGATLGDSKAQYVSRAGQENVYRWVEYELNLLGDPEMPLWTDIPIPVEVAYPPAIAYMATEYEVAVTYLSAPVEGALVCLTNGDDIYKRGYTDAMGKIAFDVALTQGDTLHLTVTGYNIYPFESQTVVASDGSYLATHSFVVDDDASGDSQGNGDGVINPGETIELTLTLGNWGNENAYGVMGALSEADHYVQILDGVEYFGMVKRHRTKECADDYEFAVAPNCPNGHVIALPLQISDTLTNHIWHEVLTFEVGCPRLTYQGFSVSDDNDSIPNPGEHIDLNIKVKSSGLVEASGVVVKIEEDESRVVVWTDSVVVGDLLPDSLAVATFDVEIRSNCPVPLFPWFWVHMTTDDGRSFSDSLRLSIGHSETIDDFEGDCRGWTYGGDPGDLWHVSSHRAHSGERSWYAGEEDTYTYPMNAHSWVMSPKVVLGPPMQLSFWRWFDVAIYGQTGFHVEVVKGSSVDTLDFIGSGGALGSLLMGDDWHQEIYDLSRKWDCGDTIQVRFTFMSDTEPIAEGVYIDDISFPGTVYTGIAEGEGDPGAHAYVYHLDQNRPNPFQGATTISYGIGKDATVEAQHVHLCVYNMAGQRVRSLVNGQHGPGAYTVRWDGKDDTGKQLASGVYFYRLEVGTSVWAKKAVLLE
jgi:hypothetical protein